MYAVLAAGPEDGELVAGNIQRGYGTDYIVIVSSIEGSGSDGK